MEDFLFTLLGNPKISIAISVLAVSSYMFNVLILRLRKYYYPMNTKIFIPLAIIPYLNACFLFMNVLVMAVNIGSYKVVRRTRTKQTYKYHQNKGKKTKKVVPSKVS